MVTSAGELMLQAFKGQGIEYIFCSPGSEWLAVWEDLTRRRNEGDNSLKYVSCRHEVLAVSTASGYTRTTGKPAAVLLHAGIGTLNAAMAIRAAYRAQVPMLICCGEALGHLLSDIEGPANLVKPYVKWSNPVNSADHLLDSLYRGFQIAATSPRGPVLISVPNEILLAAVTESPKKDPFPPVKLPEPVPADIAEVAAELLESRNPIIITGYRGRNPQVTWQLVELAELLGIGVFESSSPAVCSFPGDHPLYQGHNVAGTLKEVDAVLVVGATTPWQPETVFPNDDARLIFLDENPYQDRLPYWGYQMDHLFYANIASWLDSLLAVIRDRVKKADGRSQRYSKRYRKWQTRHEGLMADWQAGLQMERGNRPISAKWFLHTARYVLPEDSLILNETLTHSDLVRRYLSKPNLFFKVSSGGLGTGIGTAAGVKLACRDKTVVLFVGDGTFNYNPVLPGLGLCQEYGLPIGIIILNNGGYLAMKRSQRRHFPDGWAVRTNEFLGYDISPPPDYVKVAEAFGAYGRKVDEPGDIEPAITGMLKQLAEGRTTLLDVILDS